jgi:SAM-dependent methyltransferase
MLAPLIGGLKPASNPWQTYAALYWRRSDSFRREGHMLDVDQLLQLQQPPEPFAPGTTPFWDDPHISQHLLAAHLDPSIPAASRPPAEIDRSVTWLIDLLDLHPTTSLLDLGCGPGLYATRFAARGLHVTGVDFSQRSIDFAVQSACEQHLDITYRCQDYLTLDETQRYDVALLIYGDFCTLAPAQQARLLHNIHQALGTQGYFVLDVSTRAHRQNHGLRKGWYATQHGFWKPGPHLVLEQGFDYPTEALYLDQYIVIEATGRLSVYRNWFQDYTPTGISAQLSAHGFEVHSLWDDLLGTPLSETGEWIGIVAQKV